MIEQVKFKFDEIKIIYTLLDFNLKEFRRLEIDLKFIETNYIMLDLDFKLEKSIEFDQ